MTSEELIHEDVKPTVAGLDQLADHARVWIYKTVRPLSKAEVDLVVRKGQEFVSGWEAHGKPMKAAMDVVDGRFIVIAADEEVTSASGCSIDASVGFIKEMEQGLNMTLTDRMMVIYEHENEIRSCRLDQLKPMLDRGEMHLDTLVYNDLVATLGDMRTGFKVPLRDTWMTRFTT